MEGMQDPAQVWVSSPHGITSKKSWEIPEAVLEGEAHSTKGSGWGSDRLDGGLAASASLPLKLHNTAKETGELLAGGREDAVEARGRAGRPRWQARRPTRLG